MFLFQVRTTALSFLKRMYERDQLRDYIEKFALNYMQLLVHPNPPSLLFGADKDTGGKYMWMIESDTLSGLKVSLILHRVFTTSLDHGCFL